uniref:ribosomal RNA-processing protein 8 isoform X2 n=1 Tax=Podarcis muralis TaxID=64176 RepID=UPI0010A05F98|nr:ribosomal RNA-processing protein 8 isoform X2 [Podarcis muralis]
MFEEAPWGEAAELALPGPRAEASPSGGRPPPSPAQRRRLLATLRRLQSSAPRPPSPSSSGRGSSASDSEAEQQPERKRARKGPQAGSPPGAPQSQQQQQRLPARKEEPAPRADKAAGGGDPEPSSKQRSAGAKDPEEEPRLTRRQWKNRQKNKRRQNRFKAGLGREEPPVASAAAEEPPSSQEDPAGQELLSERAASLRLRMEERLESARFRFINQQLYTSSSQQAVQLFQEDPEALAVYHRGFARQVAQWPENPVQRFVRYLRQRPASFVVADFGCGDCKLARSVRNKVHCFDLVALDPRVIVCDMAQVPLDDESVDVAVFCLALMGTNLQEILEEANRVLRVGGTLLVAEVASRFPDLRAFVAALARLGFRLLRKELKGFASLDDLLRVKGITARILELNSQRMTCSPEPACPAPSSSSPAPEVGLAGATLARVSGAGGGRAAESRAGGGGQLGRGSLTPAARFPPQAPDEEAGQSPPPRPGQRESWAPACLATAEAEEEEPGSSCPPGAPDSEDETSGGGSSSDGEESGGGDVYFYYTVDERWIDYLERTEGGGLIRHTRPKMKRKSESGPDGRAQSPGKKLCKGSERGRVLGPCVASPTATFGDLRNAKAGQARCRHVPPMTPPPELQDWLRTFQRWSGPEKLLALDELIDRCEPPQIKHMMQVIEPQFQRDFISLLPKELALYVLSFLEPRDLLRAAQTCRYWRILAEDNLLWREKCRDAGIEEPLSLRKRRLLSPGFMYSPWKLAFLRQHRIDMNWRGGDARPPKVLKGHDDHVITCLQFCGNRIVSGSDDNTLKVWSAVTGECVQTLVGHTGGVWSSQMRDNIVISGSTDRTLKVWNADTGECVHTLYGHTSTVRCMHLHGSRVVSGSRDATLRLWDIETGQCLHVLMGHVAAVRCVQYDGHKVVSGAYDYTVKVWDPETESCIHTLQGHTNRVYSLQFDGTHIVSGSLDTSIRVWDAESGNCLHTLMGHQSLTSGMELRDNILVSGNADSTVKIWDIKTGQCLQTLQGPSKHQSAVTCLQFSSKFVVTSSDDGTVKLWDLKTGEFVRNLVALESGGSGGVVWRIRASNTKLVCAVGSRNGTEETKLLVLDFDVDLK